MSTQNSLRLSAATATAADRFCIAHSAGDDESPLSIVLSYDGRSPQPWTRTDMQRRIVGIEAMGENDNGTIFVALSDEGDVYRIDGAAVSTDKIAGAGLYSEDAIGFGPLTGLARQGDALWAFGLGGQIYRGPDGWQRIPADSDQVDPSAINVGQFDVEGAGWFCGSVAPPLIARDYKPDPELERQLDEAQAAGNFERWSALMEELGKQMRGGASAGPTPLALHYQSGNLSRTGVSGFDAGILFAIHIESPSRIWLLGSEGAILSGNAEAGFRPVTHAGQTTENLIGMTRFRDRFVIASDYGLYDFDGHVLTQLKPRLPSPEINRNVPTPLRIQGLADMLMYFDYKHGVCRWDGKTWDWIDIPKELLERDFRGLR